MRDSFTTFLSRVTAVGSGWRESLGVPEDSGPRMPSSPRVWPSALPVQQNLPPFIVE